MLVYVLNKNRKPLMPCKPQKARKLLRNGKAKVIRLEPFTIQLLYGSSGYRQHVTLGVDAGSKHIGLSATTSKKELFAGEVKLRTDIVNLLSTRRQFRRSRRSRKTRYRKSRFLNRVHSKHKGWLAPSIENKIQCHLSIVTKLHKILPIDKVIVETASFDIQKIKNPNIQGDEYQKGEQLGFWNIREYVLFRDGHKCQCCKGKSRDKVLNVHHIESRKTGGNAPNNLITLCETCHKGYHNGTLKLPKFIKRGTSFKDAIFMGIMRWSFYNRLKEIYPNVSMTFGYITKQARIGAELPKEHYVDARCISGNALAKPLEVCYFIQKVRRNNRQIHKAKILKGGIRKNNQAPFVVKGFRLFDMVLYNNKLYYIFGRRSSGAFDIRTLDGEKVNKGSINCKYLRLINFRKTWLIERRSVVSSHD